VEVRAERPEDAEAVARLVGEAFGQKGACVSRLVGQLRASIAPASCLSLVASDDGAIVGHVMFSRGFVDATPSLVEVEVLSPLSVAGSHRGRGIGAELVANGVEVLADRGVPAVFLEGDPRYYGRLGFEPARPRGFGKPSNRIPDEAFQVLLTETHEPWMTGALVYPEAFWLNDLVGLRDTAAAIGASERHTD